ncbi:AbiJ-NTD4 domain-containing protein, partial [Burkholderia pseudomallei]
SVNRLFFMTSFSPLEAILSSFNWSENSRAGHGDSESQLLYQCAAIAKDVLPYYGVDGKVLDSQKGKWKSIHDSLARELGVSELWPRYFTNTTKNWQGHDVTWTHTNEWFNMCEMFMTFRYADAVHRSVDRYMKNRLSLIELVMRHRQNEINVLNRSLDRQILDAKLEQAARNSRAGKTVSTYDPEQTYRQVNAEVNKTFDELVNELNVRFQRAGVPLSYHNGYIQVARDQLIEQRIAKPFWDVIADTVWENVALHMNQALDYRDAGVGDAAWYACMALESTIKIVSAREGRTTGREKGAHNYIDNLVAEREGVRFIQVFEMEVLKSYFTQVRNQFGHGPGTQPMPNFTAEQTDWAIEFAMSWIRTLVRRLKLSE